MTDLLVKDFNYKAFTPGATFAAGNLPDVSMQVPAASVKIAVAVGGVDFSFDGSNVDGTILPADGMVEFKGISKNKIWFKSSASGTVRVWAWI